MPFVNLTCRFYKKTVECSDKKDGNKDAKKTQGIIHLRRRQIFTIFDPYPPSRWQFFTTVFRQIWPIFDPFPPKQCRRLKWMVPKDCRLKKIFDHELISNILMQDRDSCASGQKTRLKIKVSKKANSFLSYVPLSFDITHLCIQ